MERDGTQELISRTSPHFARRSSRCAARGSASSRYLQNVYSAVCGLRTAVAAAAYRLRTRTMRRHSDGRADAPVPSQRSTDRSAAQWVQPQPQGGPMACSRSRRRPPPYSSRAPNRTRNLVTANRNEPIGTAKSRDYRCCRAAVPQRRTAHTDQPPDVNCSCPQCASPSTRCSLRPKAAERRKSRAGADATAAPDMTEANELIESDVSNFRGCVALGCCFMC